MKHARKTRLGLLIIVAVMFGLSFACVPLYRLFCAATGWGGITEGVADETAKTANSGQTGADTATAEQSYTIRLDANVSPELDWTFTARQPSVEARIGEIQETLYHVRNNSSMAITGIALHNVTPPQAAAYIKRIKCFCDVNKTLQAGEEADLPVMFRIDPAILDDPDLKGVKTFTWSYTYFKAKVGAKDGEKDKAFKNSKKPV